MSLTGKAVNYLQQQYPNASFLKDIILRDDGDGNVYIYYWGVGTPKPTVAELNAAAESMTPKMPYPTVEEQLALIYNDMKNKTKTFVDTLDQLNN